MEEFGSEDGVIIAAILQSLAADAVAETIQVQVKEMTECIYKSAGQVAE